MHYRFYIFFSFGHSLLSCAVGSGHSTLYNSHNYTYELLGCRVCRVQFFRSLHSPYTSSQSIINFYFVPSVHWTAANFYYLFVFFSHSGVYFQASFLYLKMAIDVCVMYIYFRMCDREPHTYRVKCHIYNSGKRTP